MLATEVEELSLLASILQKRMRDNALDEQDEARSILNQVIEMLSISNYSSISSLDVIFQISHHRFSEGVMRVFHGRHVSYMFDLEKPEVYQRFLISGFRSTFFVYTGIAGVNFKCNLL